VLKISVFIQMNILAGDCRCFLGTAEEEGLREAGRREQKKRIRKEGWGGRAFLGTRQSSFCRFHPEYIKELKCTQIPH
jgi:hypothetical protein